jgi:hypothetical protein
MNGLKQRTQKPRWLCVGLLMFAVGRGVVTLPAQEVPAPEAHEMAVELDPATTRIEFTLGH